MSLPQDGFSLPASDNLGQASTNQRVNQFNGTMGLSTREIEAMKQEAQTHVIDHTNYSSSAHLTTASDH
jgi:hypothetical protein